MHIIAIIHICSLFIFANSLSIHPKVLLISFDGFRNDLLNSELVPTIFEWSKKATRFTNGVESQYMTFTAPNHMSIATGHFEEHHGIVGNYFFNEENGKHFDYFNSTQQPGIVNESMREYWYKSDPIWLTNERWQSSRRSASFYWPNGDAQFPYLPHKPSFAKAWKTYGSLDTWMKDADEVIDAFIRDKDPVNFAAWYIAEPDHVLHTHGFHDGELTGKLTELDKLWRYFTKRMETKGLDEHLDIILTADHGHAEIIDEKHVMCVKDFVNSSDFEIGDNMLYPNSDEVARKLYQNLTDAVKKNKFGVKVHWKKDLPDRFHYRNNSRIGGIVLEPLIGSAISFNCNAQDMNKQYSNEKFHSSTHGMDPQNHEMRAFLLMSGPSFSQNYTIDEIPKNIDLYGLMCHLLGIAPTENDGSMEIVKRALKENRNVEYRNKSYAFSAVTDTMGMLFILLPSMCIVVLFFVYGCKQTVMKSDPNWGRSDQSQGYRPLQNDGFEIGDEDDDVEAGGSVRMSNLLDELTDDDDI